MKDPIAGIFIQQQAKALRSAGVNINIFFVEESLRPRRLWKEKISIKKEENIPTYRINSFVPPKRIKSLRKIWFKQWRALMQAFICENDCLPELLHAHSFVGGAAAKDLSENFGIPYILTEHHGGLATGEIPGYWERELKEIYSAAKKVLVVSELLRLPIQHYGGKVVLLPNMIDTDLFFPDPLKNRSAKFRIINVGGLDPEKDVSPLILALSELEDPEEVELDLVGEGPLRKRLKHLAEKLGLEDQVHFVGRKSPERLADLMRKSDLFVSTSRLESFGMALVEAMACGLPVISFKKGIAGTIINGKNGRLVENQEELVRAIDFFRKYSDTVDPVVAFSLVEKCFGRNTITENLTKIYNEYFCYEK